MQHADLVLAHVITSIQAWGFWSQSVDFDNEKPKSAWSSQNGNAFHSDKF